MNLPTKHGRIADPRQQIEQARARLLDGRGPGASAETVTRFTRNRLVFAGEATSRRLERFATSTAVARGKPDEIIEAIGMTRAGLEIAVGEVVDRINPVRALRARRSQLVACWPTVLAFTAAVPALWRIARRYRKARRHPRRPRPARC